jgi:Rod binding domain-containing protein
MAQIENIQATTPQQEQPRDPKLWKAAQQFENLFVEQLAKQLQQTAQPEDGDDDEQATSGATSFYQDMLPGALADGVTAAGGLGLTQQLYDAMAQQEAK